MKKASKKWQNVVANKKKHINGKESKATIRECLQSSNSGKGIPSGLISKSVSHTRKVPAKNYEKSMKSMKSKAIHNTSFILVRFVLLVLTACHQKCWQIVALLGFRESTPISLFKANTVAQQFASISDGKR